MTNNVLIPLPLLERIIYLFESWDISNSPNCYDYYDVLTALKVKMQKLDLRKAYAEIIHADSVDAQNNARIEYLKQKSQLGSVDVGYA
jgi:hypothetical protein